MNPEAQRIAIAEACGWTKCYRCTRKLKPRDDGVELAGIDPNGDHTGGWIEHGLLPRYLNDLNAMHEAEKVLTPAQKVQRVQNLCIICDREYVGDVEPSDVLTPVEMTSMFLDCTAAQRAEAFLKALGLWKETI